MAVDITNVNRLTFGVNFLGGNGAEEVNGLWNSRFAEREAFLVTADPQTDPKEIFDQFCQMLNQREQTQMVGRECMLTFFVDYTAELPKNAEKAIWGMRKVMESRLGCSIQAVIQFAYVGCRGDHSQKQRENVKKALENNGKKQAYENYRLLMVGKSVLEASVDHNWKAAVVFVDLLRRCQSMKDYLPVAGNLGKNDIGFLRYGEFDQVRYQQLQDQQKRLMEQLANSKPDGLRALVEEKRKELIEQMESAYTIDGALHPQHPDMIVPERSGWFGADPRREADRGKNQAYNDAAKATRAAVEATGRAIKDGIEAAFAAHIEQAPGTLEEFFEKSNAGINLKLNSVGMQSALYMQPYSVPSTMPKLTFKYSPKGVQDEIQTYLEYMKMESIAKGLRDYSKALQSAFEAIPKQLLEEQKKALEKERNNLAKKITNTLDAQSFCKLVAQDYPPESIFEITNEMVVENQKFLLCRFGFAQMADEAAALGMIGVHSVDEHMCGMVRFDDAPVKALMVESVECRDWVLDHFLPEADWGDDDEFDF